MTTPPNNFGIVVLGVIVFIALVLSLRSRQTRRGGGGDGGGDGGGGGGGD
jgi:hypothetical protein